MNWDDLKYLLALSRGGTLTAAAESLGVNQTTVSRRLERLESALGVALYERVDQHFLLTPEGEGALKWASQMEQSALTLTQQLMNETQAPEGTVRVTSVPLFIANVIAPHLQQFHQRYPKIRVELVGADSDLNLSRREADLAIRFARPTKGQMVIKKLGELGFAAYVSTAKQSDELALNDYSWVGYDEKLQHFPEAQWLANLVPPEQWGATATDVASLIELVQSGLAAAVLPCISGDASKDLIRLTGENPVSFREIWLLSHPESRKARRIQLFSEWLQDLIQTQEKRLLGYLPRGATQ